MPDTQLVIAQRKAKSELRRREAAECEIEEASHKSARIMHTVAQDAGEIAGATVVAELAAVPGMMIPGESVGMMVGGLASFVRPFTDPTGWARTGMSIPQGLLVGGLAINRFKAAIKRRVKKEAEG